MITPEQAVERWKTLYRKPGKTPNELQEMEDLRHKYDLQIIHVCGVVWDVRLPEDR